MDQRLGVNSNDLECSSAYVVFPLNVHVLFSHWIAKSQRVIRIWDMACVWYSRNSTERIREEKSKKEIAYLSCLIGREIGKLK